MTEFSFVDGETSPISMNYLKKFNLAMAILHLVQSVLILTLSLFIDEIRMRIMFKDKNRNQIGYQLGGSIVDLPIKNLKITTEYTRIYPYVYRHYIPTQTYG